MTSSDDQLSAIAQMISAQKLPPVHNWQPEQTRDIDMHITRSGDWYYCGSRIQRERMVRLFSTVLRADDDGFTYLVTPQERLRISIEDAPFTAILVERHGTASAPSLVFTTNIGAHVIADTDHRIEVEYRSANGEPSPYVVVRQKLRALLLRPVFYQLAEWAEEREGVLGVESGGVFMPLAEQALESENDIHHT